MEYIDQLGRSIALTSHPKRIISLVPSQTELLADLNLENEVVGITKFCVHPDIWFKSKTRVGGTKKINHNVIRSLKPDLIIANKEENTKADIDELNKNYPVWVSDVTCLSSALDMMSKIGQLCNRRDLAQELCKSILDQFEHISKINAPKNRAVYLIWNSPIMGAGNDTFIHDMLHKCGFQNCISPSMGRYPVLDSDWWNTNNPDYILLSSEPFPFKSNHISEVQKLVPSANVKIVDGEAFSWYGSHLLKAPEYFNQLIYDLSRTFPE